jgi:hypothetical protein
MGRNLKSGMDYFDHSVNAKDDMKIKKLRAWFGVEGYGVYFYLLENIYADPGYALSVETEDILCLLANEMKLTIDRLQQIIFKCVDVGLFDKNIYEKEKKLTSNGVRKRAEEIEEKRRKEREKKFSPTSEGIFPRENKIVPQENEIKEETIPILPQGNTQIKEDKTKLNKTKKELSKKVSKARPGNLSFDGIISEFTQHEPLRVALIEFVKMRKLIRKPLTSHSLELCLTERNKGLFDLSDGNHDTATQIVNQSIRNSWQGLFELKADKPPGQAESKNERQNRVLRETLQEMEEKGVL